ncbi:Kazal-like serine protease inhibitor domain containing hypothetical protein [Phytophthora palmivora]|uniref:Kazal-like domain-containing protein n=1 Tax=Phytophthora palmivora TaxID=4796 RepID=A0A2P4Y6N4_9STRA|nr:Kazal-like serine protease inhibitor domain containing hypothetical protein [Phytophthora palmivora]
MKFVVVITLATVAVIDASKAADTITVDPSTLTKVNPVNQAPGRETSISTLNPDLYMGIGPEVFPGEPGYKDPLGSSSATGSTSGSSPGINCQQVCTDDYKPVCGTDNVTYGNPCKLENAMCYNQNLGKMSDGTCPTN